MLKAALAHAETLLAEGKPQQAFDACRKILAVAPDHAGANNLMGLLLHRAGRHAEAATTIARAVAKAPDDAIYRSNLGVMLKETGRLDEAVASYEQALRLDPAMPAAWSNLGVALLALGRTDDAIAAHETAIAHDPAYAEAHHNLGLALVETGRRNEALAHFERAIALKPNYANAHLQHANTLHGLGRLDAAEATARRAIELQPLAAAAHHTLAKVLRDQRRLEAAILSYREALRLKPDAVAYRNLARALLAVDELPEAAAAARASLDLDEDDALAHATLGEIYIDLGRPRPAIEHLRQSLALDPGNPQAEALLGSALIESGAAQQGVDLLRALFARCPEMLLGRQSYVFALNYLGEAPISEMVAEAKQYGRMLAEGIAVRQHHANLPDPERRLRIGLVSGDLRNHPVGRFLRSVLPALDPEKQELFAYQTGPESDDITAEFQRIVPNWRMAAHLSDDQFADRVVADGIDILLDLAGLSGRGRLRLFVRRPAPIAATWIGYFATTGLPAIDYVLASRHVIPPGEESQWVETPWYLPETYLCFSRPEVEVPVGPLPAERRGYLTFGSANNVNKLSDATLAAWTPLLHALPDSRLVLRAGGFRNPEVVARTRNRLVERGIAPERFDLEPPPEGGYAAHLARYADIDIALDPFPYNGGTTTVESLWMGVPVLVRKGDRYVAHMGENILRNVGLDDWIAEDDTDYNRKAEAFAADLPTLAALRATLRDRLEASPLMDAPRFARHLEDAFRGMWRNWCASRNA